MRFSIHKTLAAAGLVIALAVAAPSAFARGGAGTATPPATGGSGGGGGGTATGGGGGVNSGGVRDLTSPTITPVACGAIVSLTAPVGYYSIWAALWNTYTVRSCATTGGAQTYNVRVRNINTATGTTDYDVTTAYALVPGQNVGSVLDNDFAPFNTSYTVQVDVSDASGNLLTTATTAATTPAPR